MSFITIYMTSQTSLTSLGNKLVIAGALVQHAIYCTGSHNALGACGPRALYCSNAIYGMLHSGWAITNTEYDLVCLEASYSYTLIEQLYITLHRHTHKHTTACIPRCEVYNYSVVFVVLSYDASVCLHSEVYTLMCVCVCVCVCV